jgi:hypothetical protein
MKGVFVISLKAKKNNRSLIEMLYQKTAELILCKE